MNASPIRARRWTRAEYYRLDELGVLDPTERLELVGGQIVIKESGWDVRTRGPITLDEESEPEPDIAVVPGGPRDYLAAHPSGSLYGRAQIPDYWLVNLIDTALEVYREPVVDADAPYGWRYASPAILGPGDHVTPLAAPSVRIVVADLLP